MNKTKIAILGIVALFAVLTVSTASAHVTLNFVPQDSSVPEGECHSAYVEVWVHVEDPDTMQYGQFAIHYDPSCVNITDHPVMDVAEGWGPWIDSSKSSWNAYPQCGGGPGYDMIMYYFWGPVPSTPPPFDIGPDQMIANFTVHCDSSEYCVSELSVSCGEAGCFECPLQVLTPENVNLYPDNVTLVDGTFTCGEAPPPESKLVPMELGWNLVSICFEPSSSVTADVLSSITGNYSAVKEWDASSDNWADATTMDRGTGYFVYVTTACTWNHTGMNKTNPMTIPLETGLNLVGYPFNKVNSTSDALAGLNYYYAAPFNAVNQTYEDTYNLAAPAPFNDFTTINPCEGFWISSKDGGDWTAS